MNSNNLIQNKCVGCGIDMGYENPRQYCKKTFCPDEQSSSDDEYIDRKTWSNPRKIPVDKTKKWICGECTITNYTEKCILCDYTRGKSNKIIKKISNGLALTARANTNI